MHLATQQFHKEINLQQVKSREKKTCFYFENNTSFEHPSFFTAK
jgi:hypothetical protein